LQTLGADLQRVFVLRPGRGETVKGSARSVTARGRT
jgi:hypothetical protein